MTVSFADKDTYLHRLSEGQSDCRSPLAPYFQAASLNQGRGFESPLFTGFSGEGWKDSGDLQNSVERDVPWCHLAPNSTDRPVEHWRMMPN